MSVSGHRLFFPLSRHVLPPYRQRQAQFEERERKERERLAQNQVLTLPDGSVTSRITWDTIYELLRQPDQLGKAVPLQLVPGVPIQGQGHAFSRLVGLAGGTAQPTRILMEERSGRTWQQVLERRSRGPAPTPPQPHRDWPWRMTAGRAPGSAPDFSWNDLEKGLRALRQEEDSYLVLEQRDPQNPEQFWFIQSAMALEGPQAGMYAVEIGCSPARTAPSCGSGWCRTWGMLSCIFRTPTTIGAWMFPDLGNWIAEKRIVCLASECSAGWKPA